MPWCTASTSWHSVTPSGLSGYFPPTPTYPNSGDGNLLFNISSLPIIHQASISANFKLPPLIPHLSFDNIFASALLPRLTSLPKLFVFKYVCLCLYMCGWICVCVRVCTRPFFPLR
ncbi:uncharacterized protein LOC126259762 [Schistocerca nitens]|uniref:uncharacterized protein LOC126259762 n=1 Tax=Schistocerca nitens TaxID=7011 RepID=UPI00211800CC|nr:uncharacterized protein LOC126259762 [Schistocerca nitens]